jgi:uncharacterized membrane protein HdeD (DUF308 family)
VFIILGAIGLGMVVNLTLVSILFLGVISLMAGGSQIIDVFTCQQWRGALWHALIAIFYLLLGGIIIYDPLLASTLLTFFIAWILLVMGITRLIMAFVLRHSQGWCWFLLSALAAIILGGLIIMQWPYSGLWVIGLFIAIELLINGWSYVFIALAIKGKG